LAYSVEYEINNINNICEETIKRICSMSKEAEENYEKIGYYFKDLYDILNEISGRLENLENKVQELSNKREGDGT